MPHETHGGLWTGKSVAERSRRAMILEAQAIRESQMLRAEGDAHALAKLDETARNIDPNTINLKYLEMLRHMGETSATKFILPAQLTSLVRSIAAALNQSGEHPTPAILRRRLHHSPQRRWICPGDPPPTTPGNGKPSAEVQVENTDS